MRHNLRRALLPVLLLSLATASFAWALHATLTKALPAIDGTVAAAPTEITLWFNERPDVSLSNARLRTSDSSMVDLGAVRAGPDSMALIVAVRGTLKPGKQTVLFRTAGPDGHVMRGSYSFTLQP